MKSSISKTVLALFLLFAITFHSSAFAADKPNILIIWGDDIGVFNVGAYNRGMMTYKTPNIDSIANDGILFTDSYGGRRAAGSHHAQRHQDGRGSYPNGTAGQGAAVHVCGGR